VVHFLLQFLLALHAPAAPVVRVPVLMYHYVREVDRTKDPLGYGLSVSSGALDAQLGYIQSHGYHTVTAADVLSGHVPSKPVWLVFDDGYQDFYDAAQPLLAKHHCRATVAVITGWSLNDTAKRGYRSIPELRRLRAQGDEIASHSVDHRDLTMLSDPELAAETAASRDAIVRVFGAAPVTFVYPAGRYDQRVIAAVRRAGYLLGFTTRPGVAGLRLAAGADLALPRIRVDNRLSLVLFGKLLDAAARSQVRHA